jgi:hypothetical protein
MDVRIVQEQAKRRRSPPLIEGSGERRLADGVTAENRSGFRRVAERRLVDRSGRGEHELLHGPPGVVFECKLSRSLAVDRYRKLV